MSKFKYLYQTDRARLTAVLGDLAVWIPSALQCIEPISYADALSPRFDNQIFNYLADHNTRRLPPDYQSLHKVTKIAPWIKPGDLILDFGGAHGKISIQLAAMYKIPLVWLVDHQHVEHPCVVYVRPAERLPFADGFFDVVMCLMVLHHIANPAVYVAELHRCTKKYLILQEHNCETLGDRYLLDVLHGAYMHVWKRETADMFSDFVAWYRPKKYFDFLLSKKFKLISCTWGNRTTKNYMQVWQRI
jgi:ubiquinone/menaquinone biosynthesis C-methylase UbiE